MSFWRHEQIYRPMCWFSSRPRRSHFRLRPGPSHRPDESAAGYSLVGCSPAAPASASPTDLYVLPSGRNCQPPPRRGWGIFNRNFGEFSTGLDNLTE